jgi:hypothetical protein
MSTINAMTTSSDELSALKAAYYSILRQAVAAGIKLCDDLELREAWVAYKAICCELERRVQLMKANPAKWN